MNDTYRRLRRYDPQQRFTEPADSADIVQQLRHDWAGPLLRGDGETQEVKSKASRALCARALAQELVSMEPSAEAWNRATALLHHVDWLAFQSAFKSELASASKTEAWALALDEAAPLNAASARVFGEGERRAIEEAADAWSLNRSAFGRSRMFRGRPDLHEREGLALRTLRKISPAVWFDALGRAALPGFIQEQVDGLGDLDEILALLSAAPLALRDNKETGHIVAVLLARRALEFPKRVDAELCERLRTAPQDDGGTADQEAKRFRDNALAPMLEEILAGIASRPDGASLLRALFLEHVARMIREPSQHVDLAVDLQVLTMLAERVGREAQPDAAETLCRWARSDAPKPETPALVGWIAALWADPAPSRESATLMRRELVTILRNRSEIPHGFDDPGRVPGWVYGSLSQVFDLADDPSASFVDAFSALASERLRASLHSDHDSQPIGSRVLLCVGVGLVGGQALGSGPTEARAQAWDRMWSATRELWFRGALDVGDGRQHLLLFVLAHLPFVVPIENPLATDALSYVVVEPRLALEVARVWKQNGQSARAILAAFEAGSTPLRALASECDRPGASPASEAAKEAVAQILAEGSS